MRVSFDDVVIYPIGDGEADDILTVYRLCEDFLALGPEPHASMKMVLDDLAHSREEHGIFCGIYRNGEMAGIVDFVPDGFDGEKGVADLSLLMIADRHRGKGLGRKVVGAVEAEIRKNTGIREIRSGVQVNNPEGIAFWKAMGYEIAGSPELMADTTTVFHLLKTLNG